LTHNERDEIHRLLREVRDAAVAEILAKYTEATDEKKMEVGATIVDALLRGAATLTSMPADELLARLAVVILANSSEAENVDAENLEKHIASILIEAGLQAAQRSAPDADAVLIVPDCSCIVCRTARSAPTKGN